MDWYNSLKQKLFGVLSDFLRLQSGPETKNLEKTKEGGLGWLHASHTWNPLRTMLRETGAPLDRVPTRDGWHTSEAVIENLMKKLLTKGWTGPRGIQKGGKSTPAANRMVLWPSWDLQVPRTKPDVQLWETPTEPQLYLQWRSTGKELGKQTPWPLSSAALQFLSGTLGWLVPTRSWRERGPGGTVCGGEPPGVQSSVDEQREFYRLSWVSAKLVCWRSSPEGMACGDAFGRESSGLDEAMDEMNALMRRDTEAFSLPSED